MMITQLIGCLLAFQAPERLVAPPPIWEEIARMEASIKKTVSEDDSRFDIAANEPVQGYYIERVGVLILVPVRYKPGVNAIQQDEKEDQLNLGGNAAIVKLSRGELESRVSQWQDALNRSELIKESNFSQVVTNLKNMIPELIGFLKHLPQDESMVLVVEERVPAWFHPGFSLKHNATRKVVTLTVDKDLISQIHANKTVMPEQWLKRIKSTTTNRRLITRALREDGVVED